MKSKVFVLLVCAGLMGPGAAPASAQSGGSAATIYHLVQKSEFDWGCFDPCMCPIMIRAPLVGSFLLEFQSDDGLFKTFDMKDVQWAYPITDGWETVAGSGTYRLGGEVALEQQLSLDLSVGGGPARHFDSGLVPGGSNFPSIDVAIALHDFFCRDSAFAVDAEPLTTSSATGDHLSILSFSVGPSPFVAQAVVSLVLRDPAVADVAVLDAAGRRIRSLAHAQWLDRGPHAITWDGRDEVGREVPAGVYFVRLGGRGRSEQRAVVKLR